ncbi:chitinase, partial [Klebsiella oxytoca]
MTKDTQVRLEGGIKSPILREAEAGETVEVLEQGEDWSLVKTSDSVIGYLENKRLDNLQTVTEEPVRDYVEEEYTSVRLPQKVSLGFH